MSVRALLSVMMFLQYFVWGSWGVQIGGYMSESLKFTGNEITWVYSTTAIAAMISPLFMGYVADRLMSTEKLLAILHLLGAGLLGYAATATEFKLLFPVMVAYALLYMPTLALTNSISFENIQDPEKEFPLVRVFGTLGWIASGWVVGLGLAAKPDSAIHQSLTSILGPNLFATLVRKDSFLYLAAGSSVILGLFCFLLPHTPPKKQGARPVGERAGMLSLLSQPSFLVFVVASFLICIPLSFYYNLANVFLGQIDAPAPTALQTVGQISEVGFMALMPLFIARLGVKKLLAVGMLAWVIRYVFFGSLNFQLVFVGLVLHGVCYDFFFVGSQIYIDSKADVSQRASAQSFLAFVTLGVAMFVGAKVAGFTMDSYPAAIQVAAKAEDGSVKSTALPDWDTTGETGLAQAVGAQKDQPFPVERLPETFADFAAKATYAKGDLKAAIEKADLDNDGKVTHAEWRIAQRNDWYHIWLWPAIAAGATLALFWLGFHDDGNTRRATASS